MKPFFPAFIFGSLLPLAATLAVQTNNATPIDPVRQKLLFDYDWHFHLGDAPGGEQSGFDDSSWRKLDLPHDWSIEGPANIDPQKQGQQEGPFDKNSPAGNGGAYLNGGVGWYRKTFTLPDSDKGKRISILFDGAYQNAQVWINGQKLGNHPYGFTSFYYDLTSSLNFGVKKNVLAVRLEVDQPCCRWYSGAGIYRHVYLITTQPVHVAEWGTTITTPKVDAAGADVKSRTEVQNESATEASAKLTTILLDPNGKEVGRLSTAQKIAGGARVSLEQTISLPNRPALVA